LNAQTCGKINVLLEEVNMTIFGLHMDGIYNDARQTKTRRALLGAFYGLLAGVVFVLVSAFINIWLNPDLPLGLDSSQLWARLPLLGLGMAVVGAVTCWWNEAWPGLVSGAATAAVLALAFALFTSSGITAGLKVVVLVFILVPIAAMIMPIAWLLRWLVERHIRALSLSSSFVRIGGLMLLALALASVGGYFTKMTSRQVEATRHMHTLLQDLNTEKNEIRAVNGMAEHEGKPYELYSKKSDTSTQGYDIRAKFEDGFTVQCTIIMYIERPPFVNACKSQP
jgi:hypothetical protein